MNTMTINVQSKPKSYDLNIGTGILADMVIDLKEHPMGRRYAIITDSTVAPLHGERLLAMMTVAGLKADLYVFPAGEAHKNRDTKNDLEDQLLEARYGRDSVVIALGGGVTGDMAGFVAATYMRGLSLIQIPTTTLAQIDSSIGGKTAIDTPQGKNLLGAFYHPKKIFMDMELLSTLDDRNYRAGLVELVKHGFIYDKTLLDYFEAHKDVILSRKGETYGAVMEELMTRNCSIKNDVVQQDDTESNLRKILNYGHTFGHAVEILSDFDLIHGEAVAVGIRFAALMANRLGMLSEEAVQLQNRILDELGMPKGYAESISTDEIMKVMTMDKKAKDGQTEWILLDEIGHVAVGTDGAYGKRVDSEFLQETINIFAEMMN